MGQINLTTALCLCWVPCKHKVIFKVPLDSYLTNAPTYLCLVKAPSAPNISWDPENFHLSWDLRRREYVLRQWGCVTLLGLALVWLYLLPVNWWQFLCIDKWLFSSCEEIESVSFSWILASCWLVLLVSFWVYLESTGLSEETYPSILFLYVCIFSTWYRLRSENFLARNTCKVLCFGRKYFFLRVLWYLWH